MGGGGSSTSRVPSGREIHHRLRLKAKAAVNRSTTRRRGRQKGKSMSPLRALQMTGLFAPAILLSIALAVIPLLIAYGVLVRSLQLARWIARQASF